MLPTKTFSTESYSDLKTKLADLCGDAAQCHAGARRAKAAGDFDAQEFFEGKYKAHQAKIAAIRRSLNQLARLQ